VNAIVENDRQALHVVEAAGTWMGRGCALLIDALNPQVIVFGSLGVALGNTSWPLPAGSLHKKHCRKPRLLVSLSLPYWETAPATWPRSWPH
jgi:predicted NBD/HSP70 family sugar kinase